MRDIKRKNKLSLWKFIINNSPTSSLSEKQATEPGLLKDSPYSISLQVYILIPRSCRNIFRLCRDDNKRWIFKEWKCIEIRKSTKMSKIWFINEQHLLFREIWTRLCIHYYLFFHDANTMYFIKFFLITALNDFQ